MNVPLLIATEVFCVGWGGLIGHLTTKREMKRVKEKTLPDQWVTTTLLWQNEDGTTIQNSFAGTFWGYKNHEDLYWGVVESCTGLRPDLEGWKFTVANYNAVKKGA